MRNESNLLHTQKKPLASIIHLITTNTGTLIHQSHGDEERKRFLDEKAIRENPYEIRRIEAERFYQTSLKEKDLKITFDSLEVLDQNRDIIERVRGWTSDKKRGGVLYGGVGTGKSTLCKALINQLASKKYICLFVSVPDVMQKFKATIDSEELSLDNEMNKLLSPDLLILDDLGAEKASDWSRELLFTIFEDRAANSKHTWFTTNLTPTEILKNYKDRIHDRMIEFSVFMKLDGESFRKRKYSDEF